MTSLPSPGTGYFTRPPAEPGPGILLLSSPWGLSAGVKDKADELAEAGFTVLAPDLYDGAVATNADQAHTHLLEADMNVSASLAKSSLRLLQATCPDPTAPVGVLGYAAGASWALWLSVRFADQCAAIASFYGTQSIAFEDATASYLLHFAEHDDDITDDDSAMMGLNLQLARREFHVEQHPGVASGFAEIDHPNFDAAAEAVAWRQTLEFFADNLVLRPPPGD
ncbi:MAG: dienelactone hydrolase family protein [Acidimicrobiales bacterium]